MRPRQWRAAVRTAVVVLAAGLLPAIAVPAAAEGGPSVGLPAIGSVNVQAETGTPRGPDQAATRALTTSQQPVPSQPGSNTPSATPLSPSATWDVSASAGDFSWSYPLRVPPAPGTLVPELALSYSSSSVDGRSSVTNNQSSWIGEGWDLSPGFVERSYGSCFDDGKNTGDLCWRGDNAVASFGGGGGVLVCCDGDGRWRTLSDDGSRVERFGGAGNGDDGATATEKGEHWRITTVDGTQYWFGSQADSRSTWTVPVVGDDANEPKCAGKQYCTQAWRWNLDKVVDRNGNVIRYFYEPETNRYGFDLKDTGVEYVRGGTLTRIDYGMNEGVDAPATGQVEFASVDRCIPGLPAAECAQSKTGNWPDTPLNLACGTTCTNYVPSFWSTKRLSTITTKVRRGTEYTPVDRWTLGQIYPEPVDPKGERKENAALWLKEIRHTGLVGGTADLPAVTFEGTQYPNRVDPVADGMSGIWRYRITGIVSESGGVTSVNYAEPDCKPGALPASPETNTKRCYPVRFKSPAGTFTTQWFHKYVVASVIESDVVSTGVDTETRYEYLDGVAWHWNVTDMVSDDRKTWSEFRGYGRVRTRTGSVNDPANSPVGMVEQRFHRGMSGDQGRGEVRVADSLGDERSSRVDHDWLRGFEYETTTYERAPKAGETGDPPVLSRNVSYPYWTGPTASRGPFHAYVVRPGTDRQLTALKAGGWRETTSTSRYDNPAARGMVTSVDDAGDVAVAGDERCTTTTYAPDTGTWLLDKVVADRSVSVPCATTPVFPGHALGDTRYTHDGKGNVTKTEVAKDHPASGPVWVTAATAEHDKYGRVTAATDGAGGRSTTAYTPAEGGANTQTVHTGPATENLPRGLVTTTTVEPAFGLATKVVDANGRVTESAYDPLGRLTEAWLPNRPRSDENPRGSVRFTYEINRDKPSVVTSTTVGPNGAPVTTTTLYDGWQRPRQVQQPAVGMQETPGQAPKPVDEGRLIVDTRYDSHGRAYKVTQPYFNNAPVDGTLWVASDTEIPGFTQTTFDGVGRPLVQAFRTGTAEAWRTTSTYDGDRVHTVPPRGGTATTVIDDAQGRTTELRQYHGATTSGAYDSTRYEYTPAGKLAKVTGADGAVWQHGYDLRGRRTTTTDPDTGTTALTYDDAGRITTSRDAVGRTVHSTYDELGRKTETRADGPTGTLLATWTYDTVTNGDGLPATATRYVGGEAYTTSIGGYTALNKPLSRTITVPGSAGLLAGSYTWGYGYGADGTLTSERYPAVPVAEVPAVTVNHDHDNWGRPTTTRTSNGTRLVSGTLFTRYGEIERLELGLEPKRVWQTFLYDTSTRRVERSIVDAELPDPVQSDVRYTYDQAGTITSIADMTARKVPDVQCFRYDYARQLSEAWTSDPENWTAEAGCTASPEVGAGPAPYWNSYRHAPGGNRLSETRRTEGQTEDRTYGYTGAQPHTLRSVAGPEGTSSYAYNAAGQTTSRAGQTLTWDVQGELTQVTGTGGTTAFTYTADGDRLLRKDSGGTTLYLGKQEVLVPAAGGTPVVTRYFTHGDRTVAMDRGTLTWLAGDHQGTSGLAINTGTLSVSQRRQDPYGVPRGEAVSWPGDRGFLGGTRDAGTGLTQLGERAYDPAVGRFISADPVVDLSDPQQMHGYAYANNSPVSFSDPSGLLRSGPDGECPRGCMYKPGHNPATNDPVDFAWNSRNCPRGTWDCTATGGTGKPPQNRSPQNCPDGKAPCRVAKGSKSKEQLELERRLLAAKIARRLSIHLEMKVGPLGPDADKYLEEMKKKAVEILSKPTQSFSVCATLQAGLIVHVESEMCFTADDYGMTFNTADKTSLQFGGGATVGLAFKANTERADQVNQKFTPSRSVGVDIVPGIGGGVEWEYDDDRQSSLTAKVDAGLRGTIGPKLAFDGSAANYGYMFRWQDL